MSSALSFGLPQVPAVKVVVVQERERSEGFLTVRRVQVVLETANGTSSAFPYDVVERTALDAAVVAAHFMKDGERHVVLRSALRPPFALGGVDAAGETGFLWELPAGLIEVGERPIDAAARELNEEIGTNLGAERLHALGSSIIPVPAMIAERQYLFHVEIDPVELGTPDGDGSALEQVSQLAAIPLTSALDMARRGELPDAKTELALRRLEEVLALPQVPHPGLGARHDRDRGTQGAT